MTKSGQIVTLTVAKKAALFHGLSALLEPSPETEQAAVPHRRPVSHQNHQPRPKSDGFALHQGYQPTQSPSYPKQEKVSHPRSNQPRPLAQQHNNRKDRPINKSTTQLSMSFTMFVVICYYQVTLQYILNSRENIITICVMNGLSRETESVENLKSDCLPSRSNGSIRSHNIVAKAYIPSTSIYSDKDYLLSEKRGSAYDWHKSPSVASSTTSDSGFQSASMSNSALFNHSLNSAFSPRVQTKSSTTEHRLNSTEEFEFSTQSEYDIEHRSIPSTDMDHGNQRLPINEEVDSVNLKSKVPAFNTDPVEAVKSDSSRRRRIESRKEVINAKGPDCYSAWKPSTRSRADALLKNFIEQAEERDRRAKREQRSLTRSGRPRARSSTVNRQGIGRSSSVDTDNRTSSGLRRSNSSVDIQNIISKAETRDRRARVEQARVQGLLPPRRNSAETKQVRVWKFETAASLIQKYEEKKQVDDPFLKQSGRTRRQDCQSEYAVPTHSNVDNDMSYKSSQSLMAQNSPGSIHSDTGVTYSSTRYMPKYRGRQRHHAHDSGTMSSIQVNRIVHVVNFFHPPYQIQHMHSS